MFGLGQMNEKKAFSYLQKQGWRGKSLHDKAEDACLDLLGTQFRGSLEFLLYHWNPKPIHFQVANFLTPNIEILYQANANGNPMFWSSNPKYTLPFLIKKRVNLDYLSSRGETWLGNMLLTAVSVERMFPEVVDSYLEAMTVLVEHGASVWSVVDGQTLIELAQGTAYQTMIEKGFLFEKDKLQKTIPLVQSQPLKIKSRQKRI